MNREKLPKLAESLIRKLASEQSFERGQDYYHGGAVGEPLRQGMVLRAECAGSDYEPYSVRVTLAKDGIAETSCTCPYDWGGICKHIVALLLTYVHKPQAFRIVPPLEALLADRSKEELITLINEMIKRKPELLTVVELSGATGEAAQGKAINVMTYRRQARRALQHDNPRAIEKDLCALRDAVASLAKASDWVHAGAVYHALLDELVRGYGDLLHEIDEDGDIAILADGFAQGLGQCLKKVKTDKQTRKAWLGALLEVELIDIELGGIDLAPSARGAILEHADEEDWIWIEQRVHVAIQKSRGWAREALVELLAERQKV
jgi:uncharacterized Zn finger protein